MNDILGIVFAIYVFVFIFVGFIGSLTITLSEIYEIDYVLCDFKEALKCIFMWQYTIWSELDSIKKSGKIILIILSSVFVIPLNVLAFLCVAIAFAIKMLCLLFYQIFEENEK